MTKVKILVSSCLLGDNCKYNGQNNLNQKLINDLENFDIIPICPEVLGGLPTPRIPSEIIGDKVINKEGIDVTKNFLDGAKHSLYIAKELNIKYAILKSRSPSCGRGRIYDGSFSGKLISGNGITTNLLENYGIEVYSEEDYDVLLNKLKEL